MAKQAHQPPQGASEEQALRLLMEFIDLSRDLERNQDDSAFRDAGGEIIYVLDENIFEIFFQPKQRRHLVRSFHAPRFSEGHRTNPYWRSFEAQIALIASEYLLSGALPGSKRPFLYMTKWHREELANRVDELSSELSVKARDNIDRAVEELERKLQVLSALESSSEQSWAALAKQDPWLEKDLEALGGFSPEADHNALRRFALTRIAADSIASSEIQEPIDQLRRSVRRPLADRYRSFNMDFQPNLQDQQAIKHVADEWFFRLAQERERARQQGRADEDRADGSLWYDAQTLALVRWAATNRARDDQRIVFVTGDSLLFNAYRRWYVDPIQNTLGYGEEFILRRTPQYSPMFNISDSENDISRQLQEDNRRTSLLINQTLEIALLPFNLARMADQHHDRDISITRGREYLVMKLLDTRRLSEDDALAFFTREDRTLRQIMPQMRSILEQLRSSERIAIGAFFPYISLRLNEEQRNLVERITQGGGAASASAVKSYLTEILDQLVIDSLRGWLALAQEAVVHFTFADAEQPPRIPPTVWYPINDGVDIVDLVEQARVDGSRLDWSRLVQDVEQRPHAVFAMAGMLALLAEDWSNAGRFAELAVRAGHYAQAKSVERSPLAEAEFLVALTKRFRLGNITGHIRGQETSKEEVAQRSIETSMRNFRQTESLLDAIVSKHEGAANHGDGVNTQFELLLAMRARSERAALRLFMAANLLAALETTELRWLTDVALRLVDAAKADLDSCWRDENRIGAGHAKYLDRLQRQYVANTAAAAVLRHLAQLQEPFAVDAQAFQISRIRSFVADLRDMHPLMRAEMLLFLIIAGEDGAENRSALARALDVKSQPGLALDRWLLAKLRGCAKAVAGADAG
jgi:hypothetical protein